MADAREMKPDDAQDQQHLQLLSIFHYVLAGISAPGAMLAALSKHALREGGNVG